MSAAQSMLHQATGLSLSKPAVERAIKNRMEQTAAADRDAYLEHMTQEEMTALVELVVVPESWFFRDPQAFQAAVEFVRTRLAAATPSTSPRTGRVIRILSIPCAGGEEPYTMAMALADAGIAPERYTIDAFDISPGCVERARAGVYGRNAFRSQDMAFRDRYFSVVDGEQYRISDALRQQVRCNQGNLLELDPPHRSGGYDLIFCRNLLIYFDKPTTKAAIAKLDALLLDDGVLFAGYAEVPSFCQHGFAPLRYALAFGLTKETAQTPGARRPAVHEAHGAGSATIATGRGGPPAPLAPRPLPVAASAPVSARAPATASARHAAGHTAPASVQDNRLEQARKLADLGQFKEADGACRDYLAQVPDSAEAYFILGLLNEHAKKPALAEDYWRRCIYLQPDHYEALCHLALLAETNSDPARAAALKARAARIYKRQQPG